MRTQIQHRPRVRVDARSRSAVVIDQGRSPADPTHSRSELDRPRPDSIQTRRPKPDRASRRPERRPEGWVDDRSPTPAGPSPAARGGSSTAPGPGDPTTDPMAAMAAMAEATGAAAKAAILSRGLRDLARADLDELKRFLSQHPELASALEQSLAQAQEGRRRSGLYATHGLAIPDADGWA